MNSGSVMVNGGVYINNGGIETFLNNIKDISDSFDNIQNRIKKVKNSLENDFDGITPTIIDCAQMCVDLSDKLKKNADYIRTKSGRIVKISEDAELKSLAEFDALEAIKQRIASLLASVGPFSTSSYALSETGSHVGSPLDNNSIVNNVDYNSIDEKFFSNYKEIHKETEDIGKFVENIDNVISLSNDLNFGDNSLVAGFVNKATDSIKNSNLLSKIPDSVKNIDKSFPFISAAPYLVSGVFDALNDYTENPEKSFGDCLLYSEFNAVNDLTSDKCWLTGIKNFMNNSSNIKDFITSDVSAPFATMAIVTSVVKFADNISDNMGKYDTYGEQAIASLKENLCDTIPLIGGIIDDCISTEAVVRFAKEKGITDNLDNFGDKVLTPVWENMEIENVAYAYDDMMYNCDNAESLGEKAGALAEGAGNIILETAKCPVRALTSAAEKVGETFNKVGDAVKTGIDEAKENINEFGNTIKTGIDEAKETARYVISGDWFADLLEKGGHAIEDSFF